MLVGEKERQQRDNKTVNQARFLFLGQAGWDSSLYEYILFCVDSCI